MHLSPNYGRPRAATFGEGMRMLWTLFVILFIMWMLGMVTSYTMGGFIHILLVLALVAVLIQLITGRQPL
jgi:ABC-type polysaccharide/polyol phosphate export permease